MTIQYVVRGTTHVREPADKIRGAMRFAGRFAIYAQSQQDADNIKRGMDTTETDHLRRDSEVCVVVQTGTVRLIMPAAEVGRFADDITKFYREMVQPSSVKAKLSLRREPPPLVSNVADNVFEDDEPSNIHNKEFTTG